MSKVGLVGVVLCTLLGCGKGPSAPVEAATKKPEPIAVKTAVAETRTIERTLSVTGSLEPDETTTVSAEVPGRIARIFYDFGQPVKKGAVVAELDKQELQISVERARAALAQALARVGLDAEQEDARPESSPAVRQALAQLEDAKFKYESAARLVKSGDISQERYTEIEKSYRGRQAAADAARDDLRTQLANVRTLKADVSLARKRLNDATIRAPFDGSVSQRNAAPGQYLKENTPILTLIKTNPLRLRAELPEAATGSVRVGTTLSFTTDAVPDQSFQATVREMNPSLDAKSRSLIVEARLVKNDARLRPGLFVQVKLVTTRAAQITVVPVSAVQTVAGLAKVFLVRDGRVKEIRVQPGQERDGYAEVPADQIHPGDRVATSRLGQLFSGAEVRPESHS